MARTLIYNARIVDDGNVTEGYVVVDGALIAEVGEGTPDEALTTAEDTVAIDARGLWLIPGLIDEHVHFRQPGLTAKADIASESRAAVAGGVTSFIDMPNTVPPTVSIDRLEEKMAIAAETSWANYSFFIGATATNIDELKRVDYTRVPGIKLFLGSSTGDMAVDSAQAIERLFAEAPALIAVHAEDNGVIRDNIARLKAEHGDDLPVGLHPAIRSREACERSTRYAVELARRYSARLHVMHVSTADELALFAPGRVEDKRITCETCPQYLIFDSDDYADRGARIKCNPAIKDRSDREALVKALGEGLIDTLGTDHAPHLLADKQGNALTAVSGMPLVQFALPLLCKVLPLSEVVEKMAHNPARLYSIDRRGFIRRGYFADLVLVSTGGEPRTISDSDVISKCGWTPADGITTDTSVELTMVNGSVAYTRAGGLADSRPAVSQLTYKIKTKP